MTRIAAAELAEFNIRVNAVQPGVITTGMRAAGGERRTEVMERCARETPLGKRLGTPEDVAALADFLLSPEADWITGQIISVDGGRSTLRTKS
mgnify:CR=1 FL=1